MIVRILRPAVEDLVSGRAFYERQQAGLGDYFFGSLYAEIDSLAFVGGVHRIVFGYHRFLARRFPCAIYYRIIAGQVVIFRIIDCRRDPRWIRQALKQKEGRE